MTRVIIHAGYHKTGTTSLQDFLNENKHLLRDYFLFYGKDSVKGVGAMARIYGQRPFPWRLRRFRISFRHFLNNVPAGGTIVLSREAFSGGMPGHRKAGGALMTSYYQPALKMAQVIIGELQRKFGKNVDITFFYTTREREAWIKSIHGHLLRSIALAEDLKTFGAHFPALASPVEEANRMRGALAPIPVLTAALEDYADHNEGPAAALLDLVGVPENVRVNLTPTPRGNVGQDAETLAELLKLNRMGLQKSTLRNMKEQLLSANKQGSQD